MLRLNPKMQLGSDNLCTFESLGHPVEKLNKICLVRLLLLSIVCYQLTSCCHTKSSQFYEFVFISPEIGSSIEAEFGFILSFQWRFLVVIKV